MRCSTSSGTSLAIACGPDGGWRRAGQYLDFCPRQVVNAHYQSLHGPFNHGIDGVWVIGEGAPPVCFFFARGVGGMNDDACSGPPVAESKSIVRSRQWASAHRPSRGLQAQSVPCRVCRNSNLPDGSSAVVEQRRRHFFALRVSQFFASKARVAATQ